MRCFRPGAVSATTTGSVGRCMDLRWREFIKKPYLPSGAAATDERVTATILHGRGMMPAMGNTMDEQELDDLMAYLHTL